MLVQQDWGHIVLTDLTLSRFLLIMCFGPDKDGEYKEPCEIGRSDLGSGHGNDAHEQYFNITKYHADRFFSLAKYVFAGEPEPNW